MSRRYCANHSDTPAVGTCIKCRKPVCGECGEVIAGDLYCNICAVSVPAGRSSWWERHINWTIALSWSAAIAFLILLAGFHTEMTAFGRLLSLPWVRYAVATLWLFFTYDWVLDAQRKSKWHLLELVIPLGIGIGLSLM